MKAFCVAVLTALITMANASDRQDKVKYDVTNARPIFEQYIKDFNRVYNNPEDKEVHYHAFVENLKMINEMNEKNPRATFGLNKFADYTQNEKKYLRSIHS